MRDVIANPLERLLLVHPRVVSGTELRYLGRECLVSEEGEDIETIVERYHNDGGTVRGQPFRIIVVRCGTGLTTRMNPHHHWKLVIPTPDRNNTFKYKQSSLRLAYWPVCGHGVFAGPVASRLPTRMPADGEGPSASFPQGELRKVYLSKSGDCRRPRFCPGLSPSLLRPLGRPVDCGRKQCLPRRVRYRSLPRTTQCAEYLWAFVVPPFDFQFRYPPAARKKNV